MKQKIALILSSFLLLSTLTVYAGEAIYGYFNGYEKVKIKVNDLEITSKIPGFIFEGTTVLPLRAVSESLGALVYWNNNTKTANLIKPNVSMLLSLNSPIDSEKNITIHYPFGKIPAATRYNFSFYLYSEVDNLPEETIQVRPILIDPDGNKIAEGDIVSSDDKESSKIFVFPFKEVNFKALGTYRIQLLLKSNSTGNQFLKIGEKQIEVK